jgi:FtsP/CotA-like multicopper oxidase with cupredoxin domain
MNGQPFFKEAHNFTPGKGTIPVPTQLPVTRFVLAPGEVVRFRMLNGCSDNLMPIVVEGHEVHLLALDGVNFETPRTIPSQAVSAGTWEDGQITLSPANRAEFLIKANSKPGVYRIVQLAQDKQFLMSEQKTIAEIVVQGAPKNMPLPKKLPVQRRYYPTIRPDEVKQVRNVVFSGTFPPVVNPYVGIDFTVNNNSYDELAVPTVVDLNSVEEWHLQVLGAHHGGTEGHPFHIHVNHFEVISVNGTAVPAPLILDTVWVPMHSTVVIRMKFNEWKGKSVFHCHILPHEDTGMMQNFLIV